MPLAGAVFVYLQSMNESVLRALMRLFAIISDFNKEGQTESKRRIVMDYLDRQYSHEIVHKYIEFYDQQVSYLHKLSSDNEKYNFVERKSKAENRILELFTQINVELEHEQKIIVLIYLLDFIQCGNKVSKSELSLVRTAAHSLKIN